MKKLTIFLLLSVMVTGASAQGFFWGVKGGFNGSFMTNSKIAEDDVEVNMGGFKPSFNIGAFMEYQFNERWAIQPELVYSRQGGADKIEDVKFWYRGNYINVPVLAKWYAIPQKFSIDLGPQVGFAFKHSTKTKFDGETEVIDVESGDLNTIDFAVAAGLTYYFTPMIGANVRYNMGLTDIVKDNDGDAIRNQVIQVGINFRF